MKKNKRFKETYWYRFVVITICFVLVFAGGVAITISTSNNNVAKWVLMSIAIALYVGALIYSYVAYRKKIK